MGATLALAPVGDVADEAEEGTDSRLEQCDAPTTIPTHESATIQRVIRRPYQLLESGQCNLSGSDVTFQKPVGFRSHVYN